MTNNKPFLLFSTCRVVEGVERTVICDIHRNSIHHVPSSLGSLLNKHQGLTIEEVKSKYDHEYDDIIDEYFLFLVNEELVFFTDDVDSFPELSTYWNEPYKVTNAIIDIRDDINFSITFIRQLVRIGCHTLQIRCFNEIKIESLILLLREMKDSYISSVEIILPYSEETCFKQLNEICKRFNRVSMITVTSSPDNESYHLRGNGFGHIYFVSKKIDSEKCCGQISAKMFTVNMKTFTESLNFNSCLNRKISIDVNGSIKNCPSMSNSYGNINDIDISSVVDDPSFKNLWDIKKDDILICKSCEYRYVCTDCRAYVENPSDIFSKPLKCGYNPYTGEWQDWVKLSDKQFAIRHYGLSELPS